MRDNPFRWVHHMDSLSGIRHGLGGGILGGLLGDASIWMTQTGQGVSLDLLWIEGVNAPWLC